MAVGCSHGVHIDRDAEKAVIGFRDRYKPQTVIHLGDFVDLAAFMSSAKGSVNEGEDIPPDIESGLDFLEKLRPTLVFIGNHEDRIYGLAQKHPDATKRFAAAKVIEGMENCCEKLKAEFVEEYSILTSWRRIGDLSLGHGFMFNEMAIRDHAELVGKCLIAHLHRVGQERGRRIGGATGYCVGTLANIPAMRYAKAHKATTKWSLGFAWGEYCDTETIVRLEQRADSGEWRLPL